MLYEDEPTLVINHLLIKGDDSNRNQFYYFPAAPRIHRDPVTGRPAFQLIKYARDVTDNPRWSPETREQVGGGFLTMTVDIGVDDAVLEDTRRQLAAYAEGEVQLAPVSFHTGAVRLVALGVGGSQPGQPPQGQANVFVEQVYGATQPSLYGDNLALFGLHLSQEGVTLIEDSFEHGGGLLGVVYDLKYTAIRPAIEVKAEVDYSRVYDRFEAQIGFQYAMIGVELDATLEWLREQGAIKIEITQYDPEASAENALRREAMDLIKNEVIAKMFKPSLQIPQSVARTTNPLEQVMRFSRDLSQPPSSGGGASTPGLNTTPAPVSEGDSGARTMEGRGGGNATPGTTGQGSGTPGFALSFSLKFVHQDERKKATFDFRVRQAVNRTAAPQGSLPLLLDQLEPGVRKDLIRKVNLDDSFFRELRAQIGVTGDWAELGIDKMVVNATYRSRPDGPIVHTDGWTFNSAADLPRSFNVLLDQDAPVRQYSYKTQVFLKDLAFVDSKDRVLVKESVSEQRDLIVQPANELKPLIVTIEAGAIDWTKTRQIDVLLHYSDPAGQFEAKQLHVFREDRREARKWIVYPVNPELRSYRVSLTYQLADEHNSRFTLDPVERADEGFSVPGPFRGSRKVSLVPAVDGEEVREINAEIVFEKGGYRYHREESFTADSLRARKIEIPIPDPDPRTDTYQARWSLTRADWEVVDFPWVSLQSPTCVMSDGVHGVEPVRLRFTRSVEEAGLTSLVVTIESLDPDGQVVDTDSLLLRGGDREGATDLLIVQGTPLRYRYRLKKLRGSESQTVESPEMRERTPIVEL